MFWRKIIWIYWGKVFLICFKVCHFLDCTQLTLFSAKDVALPPCQPGDLLAVMDTGAYGAAMARSNWNQYSSFRVFLQKGPLLSAFTPLQILVAATTTWGAERKRFSWKELPWGLWQRGRSMWTLWPGGGHYVDCSHYFVHDFSVQFIFY